MFCFSADYLNFAYFLPYRTHKPLTIWFVSGLCIYEREMYGTTGIYSSSVS